MVKSKYVVRKGGNPFFPWKVYSIKLVCIEEFTKREVAREYIRKLKEKDTKDES